MFQVISVMVTVPSHFYVSGDFGHCDRVPYALGDFSHCDRVPYVLGYFYPCNRVLYVSDNFGHGGRVPSFLCFM